MQGQTFKVDALMRVFWFDRRLAYNDTCLQHRRNGLGFGSHLEKEIWVPHLISEDEVKQEEVHCIA